MIEHEDTEPDDALRAESFLARREDEPKTGKWVTVEEAPPSSPVELDIHPFADPAA